MAAVYVLGSSSVAVAELTFTVGDGTVFGSVAGKAMEVFL